MTDLNSSESDDPRRSRTNALTAHQAPSLAMPDYVEHFEGASEIGRLSAEAVVGEYEEAAFDIESMGAQLVARVKECEAMTREAVALGEELKRQADRFRQEAKRVFRQIETCSQFTSEVRQTCTDLKEKLATPAMVERLLQRSDR
jgi:hypothetical protein